MLKSIRAWLSPAGRSLSATSPRDDFLDALLRWILAALVSPSRLRRLELGHLAKPAATDDPQARGTAGAVQTKSRFLAYMGHELRSPLTSIVGFAALAQDKVDPSSEFGVYIKRIHTNSTRLMDLVENVLDMEKIDEGRFDIKLDRCSPMAEIEAMVALHRDRAEAKGLRLKAAGTVPTAAILDPRRLRQVVGNLIHHAVLNMTHGEIRVLVTYHPADEAHPSRLVVRVVDTGPRLSDEERSYLFNPFAHDPNTWPKGATAGSALGLLLSRDIAQSLGGSLELEASEAHTGNCFVLTLPAVAYTLDPR